MASLGDFEIVFDQKHSTYRAPTASESISFLINQPSLDLDHRV